MKFKLFLKNTHLDMLKDLSKKYDIHNKEELIKKCIKTALKLDDDNLIFDEVREQCMMCFSSEPQFDLEIDDIDYNNLKKIFKSYDFNAYDTEEEEISKTIRCIINFFDEEPDLILNLNNHL